MQKYNHQLQNPEIPYTNFKIKVIPLANLIHICGSQIAPEITIHIKLSLNI